MRALVMMATVGISSCYAHVDTLQRDALGVTAGIMFYDQGFRRAESSREAFAELKKLCDHPNVVREWDGSVDRNGLQNTHFFEFTCARAAREYVPLEGPSWPRSLIDQCSEAGRQEMVSAGMSESAISSACRDLPTPIRHRKPAEETP